MKYNIKKTEEILGHSIQCHLLYKKERNNNRFCLLLSTSKNPEKKQKTLIKLPTVTKEKV